jgi:phosphatidyl-myo-inositol dimannoside synthase
MTPTFAGRVLILAPSVGLGGGIERYVASIEAVLAGAGVQFQRLSLRHPGEELTLGLRLRFVGSVRAAVRTSERPVRLVIAHVNLLAVNPWIRRLPAFRGAVVLVHGCEIWAGRRIRGRRWLRRGGVRAVAVSNFSAGALARTCQANVVRPGIAPEWYETLLRARRPCRTPEGELHLVTAFRLGSWRGKGLDTILNAVASLRTDRVRLTVCGTGPVPADLAARTAAHPWCRILPDLTDPELADELAGADVFVLATRTHGGAQPSGEGFGLVLAEAQLAGTMVIAPAFGGGGDAFQPGITGLAPLDESPIALAVVIAHLLDDPKRRQRMSEAAAAWSEVRFSPETHSRELLRAILSWNP